MFRFLSGIILSSLFVASITGAAIVDDTKEEMRLDIALCTIIFGVSGAVLTHSGWQYLRYEKIILEMSLDMLEVKGYIDVNKLSSLTEKNREEIIKYLKKAQIDNLVNTETSLVSTKR